MNYYMNYELTTLISSGMKNEGILALRRICAMCGRIPGYTVKFGNTWGKKKCCVSPFIDIISEIIKNWKNI